jgi:hypothetical protein
LQDCRIAGRMEGWKKGEGKDRAPGAQRLLTLAGRPLSVVVPSRDTGLREDRHKLLALCQQRSTLSLVTHGLEATHVEPQLAFVSLLKDDAEPCCEFDMRPRSTSAPIIAGDAKASSSQLPDDPIARGRSREGLGKFQHRDRKPLCPVFQSFGRLVHARLRSTSCADLNRAFQQAFKPSPLHFLQSCNPAILQFLRAAP